MPKSKDPNADVGGRPSKWKPEYDDLAENYCLLGATDDQLAQFFDTTPQTINNWKKIHPTFLDALKKGKEIADANVAKSLYGRATGYSHPEDKIFNQNGKAMVVPTIKHYPPDPTACIFWLKNRRKGEWKDKQEHEHSGQVGITYESDYGISNQSDEN